MLENKNISIIELSLPVLILTSLYRLAVTIFTGLIVIVVFLILCRAKLAPLWDYRTPPRYRMYQLLILQTLARLLSTLKYIMRSKQKVSKDTSVVSIKYHFEGQINLWLQNGFKNHFGKLTKAFFFGKFETEFWVVMWAV